MFGGLRSKPAEQITSRSKIIFPHPGKLSPEGTYLIEFIIPQFPIR